MGVAIRTVYDHEIPVNVYDLDAAEGGEDSIRMMLTAPVCPVAGTLPGKVERTVCHVPDIESAKVELVCDPPWSTERMRELGML